MSQTRKRPVTYGKSPLNRLNSQIPPSNNASRSPAFHISPAVDRPIDDRPQSSSTRQPQSHGPGKAISAPCSANEADERNLMQRKRRKLTSETLRDHTKSPTEPHPDFRDSPQRRDAGGTRKRLVDSLGAADEGSEPIALVSDDAPESASSPQSGIANDPVSFSAPQRPNIKLYKPATHELKNPKGSATATPSSMLRSSGVTYSRQRSFLNEPLDLTAAAPRSIGNAHESERSKDLHDVRTPRLPPEEDDVHDSKPVRSIHELRQAGDNARFREVVDSIFEEIEDAYNSNSGRCCGLAELCDKLLDPRFVHRFSEQSFDERLVNCPSSTFDSISASLMLGAYNLIISGGHASRVLCEVLWARILELATPLLDIDKDILALARNPSIGISKPAQVSIRGIRSQLLSTVGSGSPYLSPQTLALECTKSALIVLRENGHTVHPLPISFLDNLVGLMGENTPIDGGAVPSVSQTHLSELAFSILENYLVISGSFDCHHHRCLARLAQLYSFLSLDQHVRSRQSAMSYVRVILNLTNKEPAICDAFANPNLVSGLASIVTRGYSEISTGNPDKEDSALNEVILALGTLINLTEKTEQARAVLKTSNALTAPYLDQLLKLFSDSVRSMDQAHSVPEVHKNVVTGYLSILLLTICLDKDARLLVRNSLAGDGLSRVLSIAERFLQYHREVEKNTRASESLEQGESMLTARLEHIISQIRQLEESAKNR